MTGLSICLPPSVQRHGRVRTFGFMVGLAALGCASSVRPSSPQTPPATATTGTRDFARIEAEVLTALNRARSDPRGMAASLEALTGYFNGLLFKRPGSSSATRTNEGVAAVREAATASRNQQPLSSLTRSAALSLAARDHVADQSRTGNTGHTGSDGSSTTTRAARYGTWHISISENIEYSAMIRGNEVIENLLIDDGVPSRGHRKNIYDPSARVAGIACGPHPRYTAVCVIVHVGGFTPK